jgi:hypothetical protein
MKMPSALQPILLLCAASLLMTAALPWWIASGSADTHALSFYASALRQFSSAFWFGDEPYPRLLEHANGGLESPVFFFYPPIAFWLSSVFEPFAAGDPHGVMRLEWSMLLATFASGGTCFFWLRAQYPRRHALLGAILYVLLPMRLLYVYLDFNLAQCWALAWFPMILYYIDRLMQGKAKAGAGCAIFYALLVMTHVPSFIAFLPVSFAYGALTSADTPKKSWTQLGTLFASILLSLGLACAYLFPLASLRTLMNTSTGPFSTTVYDAQVFLTPDFYICLPLALGMWWLYLRSPEDARPTHRPWLVLLVMILFLMTPLSRALWDRVLLLQYLHLPARRFAATLFPVAAVLGMRMLTTLRWNTVAWAACAVYIVFAASYPFYAYLQAAPPVAHSAPPGLDIVEPAFFRTQWISPQTMTPQALAQLQHGPDIRFRSGSGNVSVGVWKPRVITFSLAVNGVDPTTHFAQIVLRRFYFPGWEVLSGTTPTGVRIYPTLPEGVMTLFLPRGNYHLTLLLDHVPGEGAGWCVTLFSLCLLGIWIVLSAWLAGRRAARKGGTEPV